MRTSWIAGLLSLSGFAACSAGEGLEGAGLEAPAGPAHGASTWLLDHAPEQKEVARVYLDHTERPAWRVAGAGAWELAVDRGEDLVFRSHVAVEPGSAEGVRACFRVLLDGEVAGRRCVRERAGWVALDVALPAREGGGASTLRLGVIPGEGHEDAAFTGVWADPSLDPVGVGEERPPDVVLVVFDTLRADATGIGGAEPSPTPTLDAVATQGTWYSQARSPASWTLPSVATLLTGLSPGEHGAGWRVRGVGEPEGEGADAQRRVAYSGLSEEVQTVAERLRAEGYRTSLLASNHYLDRRFGHSRGFSDYGDYKGSSLPGGLRAVERLEAELERAPLGEGRPRLLVVHLIEAHLPYRARGEAGDALELPEGLDVEEQAYGGFRARVLRSIGPVEEGQPEALRAMYQADVSHGDAVLAELLTLVPESAALVITSDHGEAFGEHGHFLHGDTLYDETLRVPLVVRWPEGAHAGTVVDEPVGLANVGRSLVELGGASTVGIEARALGVASPEAPERASKPQIFGHAYKGRDRVAVLHGRLKRIWVLPELGVDDRVEPGVLERELYDVVADPGELHDLSAEAPELARGMDLLLSGGMVLRMPGTHLYCDGRHGQVTVHAEQPFRRVVPTNVASVELEPGGQVLRVGLRGGEGDLSLLTVESPGSVRVEPEGACEMHEVAVPTADPVDLDQSQLEELRAMGYVE